MTNLEAFVELYRSFGIECVVVKNNTNRTQHIFLNGGWNYETKNYATDQEVTGSDKFISYSPTTYTEIVFNESGGFVAQEFSGDY